VKIYAATVEVCCAATLWVCLELCHLGVFVPEMEQFLLNLQLKYHVLFLDGLMIMILLPQLLPPQVAA
jgi:hypothetical protein